MKLLSAASRRFGSKYLQSCLCGQRSTEDAEPPWYVPAFQRELEKATAADSDRKEEILEAAEILIKYQGYIDRERMIAEKLARLESIKIKGKFDYASIQSLSTEARQKLVKIDPETIAQASRIPGVSPSDINVLLVLSGR